jgi:RNA polymerase sigma-70 factor (family 1)
MSQKAFKTSSSMKDLDDSALTHLLCDGNREAFDEIYERYWLKLYMASIKRIKSSDDAKDIVQDLFVSLWMKKETLVINRSLSSYLYMAIKYKVINYIEANIVKNNYLNSLNKAVMDYDNSTYETINFQDMEKLLDSGINNLTPKVKEVFELSRKKNLSVKEISQKLNVSDQTIKNQISKALKSLRVHLQNVSAGLFSFLFFIFL